MRRFYIITLIVLLAFPNFVLADRWYVVTALDTDDNQSGYSNTVSIEGLFPTGIIFEWTPNSESDIYGYRLHVKDSLDGIFTPIEVDIFHLDHCLETICQKTLSLEFITSIQLKEEAP